MAHAARTAKDSFDGRIQTTPRHRSEPDDRRHIVAAIRSALIRAASSAMGLLFLGPIFYPILAWSDATYQPQPA
jgi:hypothetical protein